MAKTLTSACKFCGIPQADQHSLRQAGQCDGVRSGRLRKVSREGKDIFEVVASPVVNSVSETDVN